MSRTMRPAVTVITFLSLVIRAAPAHAAPRQALNGIDGWYGKPLQGAA